MVMVFGFNVDGVSKDVSVVFSVDGVCSFNVVNVFVVLVVCGCGIILIIDVGMGVMDCVGVIYDYEVVVVYENVLGSGIFDLSVGIGLVSVVIIGSF